MDMKNHCIKVEDNNIYIYLKEGRRNIGKLDLVNKQIKMIRKKNRHLMRVNQSYGFNHYILENATKVDKIHLTDDDGKYLIPIKQILDNGEFLHFKQEGFEKQIFYTLDSIKRFKI